MTDLRRAKIKLKLRALKFKRQLEARRRRLEHVPAIEAVRGYQNIALLDRYPSGIPRNLIRPTAIMLIVRDLKAKMLY